MGSSPIPSIYARALVMAGGRSERMRATSGVHKALMKVGGKSLLERNLNTLLQNSFRDVAIAVSSNGAEIEDFILTRGQEMASAAGATLTILRETTPLGTIGAAGLAGMKGAQAMLVVNVDNLTNLPLRKFVAHHLKTESVLTIASHREPFQIPFGKLVIRKGVVQEYLEKPLFPVPVSSGTYVLSPTAVSMIPSGSRFDITHLFQAINKKQLKIAAFKHTSTWIDINDEPSLHRAEGLFGTTAGAAR